MQAKKAWRQVDGVLLLDKSSGMTSNDALQKARRLFSAAKGGHTGTLDPLASGLLLAGGGLLVVEGLGRMVSRMEKSTSHAEPCRLSIHQLRYKAGNSHL